mgnify:CR=1 FL=1
MKTRPFPVTSGGGSSGKGAGAERKSRDERASAMGTSPGRLSSWSHSMRSIVDNVAEGAGTKRVSQVSGSTNDSVRIDDLPREQPTGVDLPLLPSSESAKTKAPSLGLVLTYNPLS